MPNLWSQQLVQVVVAASLLAGDKKPQEALLQAGLSGLAGSQGMFSRGAAAPTKTSAIQANRW